MQKNIQIYYSKVDAIVSSRMKSPVKGKGLLASTKATQSVAEPAELKLIADVVQGIREAREEMKNAK
jgi:hypothetical protein